MTKKWIAALSAVVFAALLAFTFNTSPAHAQQDSASYNSNVAQITCEYDWSCVLDYVGNGSLDGYWMARRHNGTTWVRLTNVRAWGNAQIAPITCVEEDSCVVVYYDNYPYLSQGYWMARQSSGTTWVRLTRVPADGY